MGHGISFGVLCDQRLHIDNFFLYHPAVQLWNTVVPEFSGVARTRRLRYIQRTASSHLQNELPTSTRASIQGIECCSYFPITESPQNLHIYFLGVKIDHNASNVSHNFITHASTISCLLSSSEATTTPAFRLDLGIR